MTARMLYCACSSYEDDPGSGVCWRCEQPLVSVESEATNDILIQNLLGVCLRYRRALEDIAGHFCPGDERRTYNSDIAGVMDRIRAAARDALEPVGCPCVGTPDQEECPHG